MKKLLVIDGGMRGRVDDLDLIQEAALKNVQQILLGMFPDNQNMIVAGMVVDDPHVGDLTATEGWYFNGSEIFFVPSFQAAHHQDYILYLEEDFSTSENRHFHDGTDHDVYAIRNYKLGYAAALPEGAVNFSTLETLNGSMIAQIIATVLSGNQFDLDNAYMASYIPPFYAATQYGSILAMKNEFGDIMISAAFNTDITAGKIGILAAGFRPSGDMLGYFWNGTTLAPLKIKANGELWVSEAGLGTSNIISFQFNALFNNSVGCVLPTVEGGPADINKAIIRNGITENKMFDDIIPAATILQYIILENVSDNAVTMDIGVTEAGHELAHNVVLAPHTMVTVKIDQCFSMETTQSIWIGAAISGYNGAEVRITFKPLKV